MLLDTPEEYMRPQLDDATDEVVFQPEILHVNVLNTAYYNYRQ